MLEIKFMPRSSGSKVTANGSNVVMSDTDARQIYTSIGESVLRARKSKGMTQLELAKRLNLNRVAISSIENGQQNISIVVLAIIAKVLDLPVVEMLPPRYRETFCGPDKQNRGLTESELSRLRQTVLRSSLDEGNVSEKVAT
jgi:transcriptional regulator with XRE-family HTH domain